MAVLLLSQSLILWISLRFRLSTCDVLWYYAMNDTIPVEWVKSGSPSSISPITGDVNCPQGTTYCWRGSTSLKNNDWELTINTQSTDQYENIVFAYQLSTSLTTASKLCSIQYTSNGGTNWRDIESISGITIDKRGNFSNWNPSPNANPDGIQIRVTSASNTNGLRECWFNEFLLIADKITPQPTTIAPTTSNPTTSNPTTSYPTTSTPSTTNPSTSIPTTNVPTTNTPTGSGTSQPSTTTPTTAQPSTSIPTTYGPTTSAPTTLSSTSISSTTGTTTTGTTTTTTTLTTDDGDADADADAASNVDTFYSSTPLEILVLVGMIIMCPICIALLCKWQKGKTKKLDHQRTEKTAQIMEKRQVQLQQQKRAIAITQHPSPDGHGQHNAQQTFIQKQAAHAIPQQIPKIEPAISAESQEKLIDNKQAAVPPPPHEPPHEPPPNNSKVSKHPKRDIALDMISGDTWTASSKSQKKAPTFMKVKSLSDVADIHIQNIPQESALELPDIETDVSAPPPQIIPKTKIFDAETGAPHNMEELEEKSITMEDKDMDKKENISDSSSGEALDNQDKNLLAIAHEQMSSQPPPSLQTIFGKQVMKQKESIHEDSSDEDSLLKRQMDFGSTPDGPDGIKDNIQSPADKPKKPESQFVLNV